MTLTAACAPARIAPPPPLTAPPPAPPVDFYDDVLPILRERCMPCHFPGGKMYGRLPFDEPATIRVLGTELFTRIKDEGEQATIQRFLDQKPGNEPLPGS